MRWTSKEFDNLPAVLKFLNELGPKGASAKVVTTIPKHLPHPGYFHAITYTVIYEALDS